MRVAIIGTGASGFGVALGLVVSEQNLTIDFFDSGIEASPPPFAQTPPRTWSKSQFRHVMHGDSPANGRSFMPTRTHFGERPQRYEKPHSPRLFKSNNRGGFTRYWSASLFEFTPNDFDGWPISKETLEPYYRSVSKTIGISGENDRLSEIFDNNYVNQPPIATLPTQRELTEKINAKGHPDFISGTNRLAITTAPEDDRHCVACGECFSGCFRGAIFDAGLGIKKLFRDRQPAIIEKRVERIEDINGQPVIIAGGERYDGYDKIFLAAGCVASTEIVLRSLDLRNVAVYLHDNPMIRFPIFRVGLPTFSENENYISIANQIIGLPPRSSAERYAQVHINPLPDLLLRNFTPSVLWPAVKPLGNGLRSLMYLATLYLHSDHGSHHRLSIDDDDTFRIEEDRNPPARDEEKRLKNTVRQALSGTGFKTPFFPWVRMISSIHYAGTLPYGNSIVPVKRNGEFMPNVHLCDSSIFPNSPAQPLTFTVMANAMRTAREVIDG